jgi:putative nucleotidyltransferase with HDIG domain
MIIKKIEFPLKDFFIEVFEKNVYLVGGTIRDYLLYKKVDPNQDIDLVVIDHSYDDIEKKLSRYGRTNTVGKSFAVVKFTRDGHNFDISIPRRDVKKEQHSHSHKNFIIDFGSHVKLEEDLQRRDFTCNSMAMRLFDNKLVDPFNGVRAIKDRKIIMTGPDTFFDDPLRILRCARFSSVHRFSIDHSIYARSKTVELNELSKERIQEELFRTLLESDRPSLGLNEYFKLAILEKIFSPLFKLTMTIQDSIFHPERDEYGHHSVWAHTLITVDVARKVSRMFELDVENTLALLLAALLHDVGKPSTTKWEFKRNRMTVTSLLHDSRGTKIAERFLTGLKIETRSGFPLRSTILTLIKNHHRIYDLYRNKEEIGFKAISRIVKDLDGHDFLLALLDFSDRQSRKSRPLSFSRLDRVSKWFLEKKDELNISKESIKPLVRGRDLLDLGIPPGKKMGELLKKLYELQLDGEFNTREDGLIAFKKLETRR